MIMSIKSAVLLTVPLTERRFNRDIKNKKRWFRKSGYKEFARIQNAKYPDGWVGYENAVVKPVMSSAMEIESLPECDVFIDITHEQFRDLLLENEYQIIFLIAHNIVSREKDQIEFADFGVQKEDVVSIIGESAQNLRSLVLFVCTSGEFESFKKKAFHKVETLGSSNFEIPLVPGMEFIKLWILAMKDQSFEEAYNAAMNQLL